MSDLTEEMVNQIYEECFILEEEIKGEKVEYPVVKTLIPFPNGDDTVFFDFEKINEYRDQIGILLDQIPFMGDNNTINFALFGKRKDNTHWTLNLYTMQRLYLLGVASNQCGLLLINGNPSITRLSSNEPSKISSENGTRKLIP